MSRKKTRKPPARQTSNPPPAPTGGKDQPSRRRRLLTWTAGILAAALTAVLTNWVTGIGKDLTSAASTLFKGSNGPAIEVVVANANDDYTVAMPAGYQPTSGQRHLIDTGQVVALYTQLTAAGGMRLHSSKIYLNLTGNRAEKITILGIHTTAAAGDRRPALAGTLFTMSSQGDGGNPNLVFDLDSGRSAPYRTGTDGKPTGRPYFDDRTISLVNHESLKLTLSFNAQQYLHAFTLTIDYTLGGKHQLPMTVRDQAGQPFRVSVDPCTGSGHTAQFEHQYAFDSAPGAPLRLKPAASPYRYQSPTCP